MIATRAQQLFAWVKNLLRAARTPPARVTTERRYSQAVPKPQPQAPPPTPAQQPKAPVAPAAPPARPLSAVEILQIEPGISPAELASRAGVTLSYARSLVRRRNKTAPAPAKAAVPPPSREVSSLKGQVKDLAKRLHETEGRLGQLNTPEPAVRAEPVCRRTEVLDRSKAGASAAQIAEVMQIPQGEVEFILKVARIGSTSKAKKV